MNTRSIVTLAGMSFLLLLVQLVAALVSPAAAIVCGVVVALAAFGLLHFFEVELEPAWIATLAPVVSSALGIAIIYFLVAGKQDPILWLAPVAGLATCGCIQAFRRSGSRRCGLCNRRIGRGVSFQCPRCGLLVCEQNCWVFGQCRCRLCEQNRVPFFPTDGRWWDRNFGPRAYYGRCQLCMATPEKADLRVCGKCGRPQCRECWDFANGQCSRCQWIVEDLPEPLRPFMSTSRSG